MRIGDCVRCIYPGLGHGPDCIVGNILVIIGFAAEHWPDGRPTGKKALVFGCHPYSEGRFIFDSACADRFVLVGDETTDQHEKNTLLVGTDTQGEG